jgi:hypothetical protein
MAASSHYPDRFRRSDRVDETRVGDRVVLYHRDTGSGVVLNPTGSLIWEALAMPCSADDLAQDLSARYPGMADDKIRKDVNTYVESLRENGLIADAGGSPPGDF